MAGKTNNKYLDEYVERSIDDSARVSRRSALDRFPGEIRYEKMSDSEANVQSKIDTNAMNNHDRQTRYEDEDERSYKKKK